MTTNTTTPTINVSLTIKEEICVQGCFAYENSPRAAGCVHASGSDRNVPTVTIDVLWKATKKSYLSRWVSSVDKNAPSSTLSAKTDVAPHNEDIYGQKRPTLSLVESLSLQKFKSTKLKTS